MMPPLAPLLPLRPLALSAALLAAALLLGRPAAAGPQEARAFLADYSAEAIATLSDESQSPADREAAFRRLLRQGFELEEIARFLLGRHAESADPAEFRAFVETFETVLARRYAPLLREAEREDITVGGAEPVGTRDDLFLVTSRITLEEGAAGGGGAAEPQVQEVVWRVKETPAGYRILDVMTQGISMAITLRDEYGEVLQSGGLAQLIDRLRAVHARG